MCIYQARAIFFSTCTYIKCPEEQLQTSVSKYSWIMPCFVGCVGSLQALKELAATRDGNKKGVTGRDRKREVKRVKGNNGLSVSPQRLLTWRSAVFNE